MPRNLGEREIIRLLTSIYGKFGQLPLDFDDDVAAIPWKNGKWVVLKSDMLVARTDVPPGMSLWQAARKAVVATVSDFAAKGVRPRALLTSLGLPQSFGRAAIRQIGAGLEKASREYDCPIVGGDINQSDDFIVDCLGMGLANPKTLMRRDRARPGDIVAVTGKFGNSSAGLRYLLSAGKSESRRSRTLENAVLLPRARLREGLALARTGVVTASIDSSDGLGWSLHELARSSHVGISLNTVPLAAEAKEFAGENGISPLELALYGGEEYELVLTIRREGFKKAKKKVASLIPIGSVVRDAGSVTANLDGRRTKIEARGFEHFRSGSWR